MMDIVKQGQRWNFFPSRKSSDCGLNFKGSFVRNSWMLRRDRRLWKVLVCLEFNPPCFLPFPLWPCASTRLCLSPCVHFPG